MWRILALLLLLAATGCGREQLPSAAPAGVIPGTRASAPAEPPPVDPTAFHYDGAFTVPEDAGDDTFAWGGLSALGFHPGRSTLYGTGHRHRFYLAELRPPEALSFSQTYSELPIAQVLRGLVNATELWQLGLERDELADVLPVWAGGDWVVATVCGTLYNATGFDHDSMALVGDDLAAPMGRWHVGPRGERIFHGMMTNGFALTIPLYYQRELGGLNLAVGSTHREGGEDLGASVDRALIATRLDPTLPPGGELPGVVLLAHYKPHFVPDYDYTTTTKDAVWIDGTVIFLRKRCRYGSHYSHPVDDPDRGVCHEDSPGWVCGREGDAPPGYEAELVAYAAGDLLRVARGELDPWAPQPVWVWSLEGYTWPACEVGAGSLAWDEARRRLYLSQSVETDGEPMPIVLRFTVKRRG